MESEESTKEPKDIISEDLMESLSIICDDFSYGCESFPTFGLEDKDIPKKVQELLREHLPF